MARNNPANVQQQLQGAFEAFRDALQKLLEEQAQQSVNETLEQLARQGGPFKVEDAQIEVVIRDLTVASSPTSGTAPSPTATPPRTPRKRAQQRRTRRTGGRRGGVKEAMLAAMGPGEDLSIADLSSRLEKAGVATSNNNLHQQLRRLTQAGEIARSGRGRYRRAS